MVDDVPAHRGIEQPIPETAVVGADHDDVGVMLARVLTDRHARRAVFHVGVDASRKPIGGLGVYLVKQLTDSQDYERRDDKNHLVLRKRIEQDA